MWTTTSLNPCTSNALTLRILLGEPGTVCTDWNDPDPRGILVKISSGNQRSTKGLARDLHHSSSFFIILHHSSSFFIILHRSSFFIALHHSPYSSSYFIVLHHPSSFFIILHRSSSFSNILHHPPSLSTPTPQ